MQQASWQAASIVWARHTAALTLLAVGVTLLVAGCGRIPESVAGTLSAPTAAPTRTAPAAAANVGTTGAGGTSVAGAGAGGAAPSMFKLAETPAGNPESGQRIYVQGCANCHGMTGTGGGGNQVALVGNGGLIPMRNIDTASKFATVFTANAAHASVKDNDQIVNPQRLINMYAYLIAQMNG